jgi:hypothetical protein
LLLAGLHACSVLPPDQWPARLLGEIELTHPLDPRRPVLAEVPASDARLSVLELRSDPPALRELFRDGRLFLELPAGDGAASLRMRYRLFVDPADPQPLAAQAAVERRFPGSRVLRHAARLGPAPGSAPEPPQ